MDRDAFGKLIGFCENCRGNIYEHDVRFYVDLHNRRLLFCHYCVIGVNPDDIDVD